MNSDPEHRMGPLELSPAQLPAPFPNLAAGQGSLTCPPGVPWQHHARRGRGGDDDVGHIQLVVQDRGLIVAAAAAADTHFKA